MTWYRLSRVATLTALVLPLVPGVGSPGSPVEAQVPSPPASVIDAGFRHPDASDPLQTSQAAPTSFIEWLFSNPDESEPPQTSRGPQTCFVTLETEIINPLWNDTPVFILSGNSRSLAVYRDNRDTPIWTYPVSDRDVVVYDGPPLRPGTVYTLRAQHPVFPNDLFEIRRFTVLSVTEQVTIALDLATIEADLQATESSAEAIARAQADYFWQRGLITDAWAEILPFQGASDTIDSAIQTAYDNTCPPSLVDSSVTE